MRVRNFWELDVYQKAFALQQAIFEESKRFPREEQYALTDQIRRSSRSIGANVAEAWKKRLYVGHFISKLTDSDSEQAETIHWLKTAYACGYLSKETQETLILECEKIGRMLGTMIRDAEQWCFK